MKLHHISLIISDIKKSEYFYSSILKLEKTNRPELSFPGLWYLLGQQQLHLLCVANPDPVASRPGYPGRDRHIALTCECLATLESKLRSENITYQNSSSGRAALFLRDPDGNGLEIIQAPSTK